MRKAHVLGMACLLFVPLGGPAAARAPRATAWWHASNQGTVSVDRMPDVSDSQLLVEGAYPGTVAGQLPQQSALAAVVFSLSRDEVVGRLRLRVDSSSLRASVRVCRVTTSFAANHNGAWSDVPSYDCDGAADAVVDGDVLDFGDVGHLREDTQLAVILLPSSPGRVVIERPDDDALEVIDPTAAFVLTSAVGADPRKTQASAPKTSSSGRSTRVPAHTGIGRPGLGVSGEVLGAVTETDPFHISPRGDAFISRRDLEARAATGAVLITLLAPFVVWGTWSRRLDGPHHSAGRTFAVHIRHHDRNRSRPGGPLVDAAGPESEGKE